MSNHLAVATVSATLRSVVDTAAQAALSSVSIDVETGRPDVVAPSDGAAAISVFLYQVSPSPHWRNDDLPTRRGDGSLAQRPQAALDLSYLLTFFGDENLQQPETLLGGVVSALHAEPILSRERIEQVVAAEAHLAASDLASQVELVRFVPIDLSLEELSKLWSVFFQTAYRLSVAFKGSVVLIQPETPPQPSRPVRLRNLYVETLRQPVVETAGVAAGPFAPILPGDELIVRGRNLRGAFTQVAINSRAAAPTVVQSAEIRVPLTEPPFPAGTLRAGVAGLQVVQQRLMGTPETLHRGVQSNVYPIVLRPILAPIASTPPVSNLAISVTPQVGRRQEVFLLLNSASGSYAIPSEPRELDTSPVVFDIQGVTPDTYLVRVRVDGAESLLDDGGGDVFIGPTLEVTP